MNEFVRPVGRLGANDPPDVVLISCGKSKLSKPAMARDLYTSTIFRKGRAYAERARVPWFIISAEHGLVLPHQWLSPYERYLPDTSQTYRAAWAAWVAARLEIYAGPLPGKTIEIHAGQAYVDIVRPPLEASGARVSDPLHGLNIFERLAWYTRRDSV